MFPDTPERAGYTHEDLLIIYPEFNGTRRAIYFDNEEHIIHYEVTVSPDEEMITLMSDPAPATPQFRYTYRKTGEETMEARFEIALPGQPGILSVYLEGTASRIR